MLQPLTPRTPTTHALHPATPLTRLLCQRPIRRSTLPKENRKDARDTTLAQPFAWHAGPQEPCPNNTLHRRSCALAHTLRLADPLAAVSPTNPSNTEWNDDADTPLHICPRPHLPPTMPWRPAPPTPAPRPRCGSQSPTRPRRQGLARRDFNTHGCCWQPATTDAAGNSPRRTECDCLPAASTLDLAHTVQCSGWNACHLLSAPKPTRTPPPGP